MSKFKIATAKIKSKRFNNLQVNRDYDCNPKNFYPVLLYTPDMEKAVQTHYHIPLTRGEAKKLREWLERYEKDISNAKEG